MSDSPGPRSKRQKVDKGGRFAALARLKDLKGAKNKLQLNDEVDNVYDTVEEDEYEQMVLARADDDWIVDDGTGYVEDGREIFDEDDENDDQPKASGSKGAKQADAKSKKRLRDINASVNDKSSIKRLFGNVVPKKTDAPSKLAEDDILSDILGEMDTDTVVRPSPILALRRASKDGSEKKRVNQFMQGFATKTSARKLDQTDDDLIDEMLKKQKPKTSKDVKPTPTELNTAARAALLKPKEERNVSVKRESVDPLHIDEPVSSVDVAPPPQADDATDMDFSILDDDENQFEAAATEAAAASIAKSSAKSTAKPEAEAAAAETAVDESESYEKLLQSWENTCNLKDMAEEFSNGTAADEDFGLGDNRPVRFWFWDAWEDPFKRPGQLYLFGKIAVEGKSPAEYKSACVKVENIDRCLYLLPREFSLDPITKRPTKDAVKFLDVYNEFTETISPSVNVTTFRSRKVAKNFAFSVPGVSVPATCDYLEVRYDGSKPAPNIKTKYNHVAHIFGTNTTALETFLLEAKIKGPCWLNISKYAVNKSPFSWCKVELTCPRAGECITVCPVPAGGEKLPPPPPLVLTTLNVQTALNPKTNKNEVIMIAVLVNRSFSVNKPPASPPFQEHFCAFTRPIAQNWPLDLAKKLPEFRGTRTHKLDSERALLSWFLATFQRIDPDLVVIHDASDCQLDVICDRVAALKIPLWSRIGRLRMSAAPSKRFKDFFTGRMVCDVKQSAEELIKSRNYDLDTLCQEVLKMKEGDRCDIGSEELSTMYETADGIFRLITLTMQDAAYVLRLMCELNVLPLALQITGICGNLMGRTLQVGRADRNEWLLLHAFVEKNYIVPDRRVREWGDAQTQAPLGDSSMANTTTSANTTTAGATAAARKKPQYAGGLVLEPIKGFYDKFVLLMDFNSLYPSIIQEYNICFTTIDPPVQRTSADADVEPDEMPELPDSSVELGVLPRQIRRLVESRREVKKLMAAADCDADLRAQYNIRQLALKLTANSMYGCLGYQHSRFFAQHLAALVTFKGRQILTNTQSLVQKLNHQVIYGDTDSIMINTNSTDYEHVHKVGHTIKQAVNKMYRQVELDIDGVFKYLLLLKKKKYAAVTIARHKTRPGEYVCVQEHKGLDIVRRDWSQISVMAGKLALDELLSDAPMDDRLANIHAHLERFRTSVEEGTVPISMLTVSKQLTKAPKDYANTAALPHVAVALRMNAERNRRYKKGDMVAYVVCEDGTDRPAMQRAYHVDEMRATETGEKPLKVDSNYYLAQQIHPVVSRLCEPIDGTDASRIASCLGLDPAKFKAAAGRVQRERAGDSLGEAIIKTTAQKFRDCDRFTFKCPHCGGDNLVASAYRRGDTQVLVPVLEVCANKECDKSPASLVSPVRNQLVLAMRSVIRRFYENWMVCDEPNCGSNTRLVTHVLHGSRPVCVTCGQGQLQRQFGERELFVQLTYYQYMFDLSKHETTPVKLSPEVQAAYASLAEAVENVVSRSAFAIVKLSKLFAQPTMANCTDTQQA